MRFLVIFLLTLVLFPFQEALASERVKDWGFTTQVVPMKEWTITFKSEINSSALDHIYILDEQSKIKPMTKTINTAKNAVILTPITPYEEGQIYTLKIDKQLTSAEGDKLVEGGEKKFYVPSTEQSQLVLKDKVQKTSDFKLESSHTENDETIYHFIYTGTNTYAINDLIIVNDIQGFDDGFAGKITAMRQQNGQQIITMTNAPLEDVIENIVVNSEVYLTADQLQSVAVAGYNVQAYNVRDTALNIMKGELKLTPKFNGSVQGYDAQVDFVYILKDLKLNFDVDMSTPLKVKQLRVTLSGKQTVENVAKFGRIISETAQINERPSLKNKENLKDFEYKLAKVPITISIPGVSGYVETGLTFEVDLAGGAQFATEEESEFEFGVIYKDDEFHEVIDNQSKSNAFTVMGFGELDAKFGIYNAVGVQAFSQPLVEASLKGGAYSTFGAYAGFTSGSKACFAVESGAFSTVGVHVLPDSKHRFGTDFERKIPIVNPIECNELLNIKPTNDEIMIAAGQTKEIKINKTSINLKNGTTSSSTIKAKKLDYVYDKNAVNLDRDTGEVTLLKNAPDEVKIQVSYNEDGKTFKTSVLLIKAPDEQAIQKAVDQKKSQLQAQGMKVFETKMLNTGRQLLTTRYEFKNAYSDSTFITVHNYDEKTGVWSKVYDKSFRSNFPYKKKPISINNNSLEQHLLFDELGSWEGEWPVFLLVGSKDGKKVETLYVEENYPGYGTVESNNNSFLICDNGKGNQFSWNGSKFINKNVSCESPSNNNDIQLMYNDSQYTDAITSLPTIYIEKKIATS